MLGENLKKALSDARIPHQEAADRMGISKGNLYNLFKKDSFEVDYLRRASEITGLSISDFFDYESKNLDDSSKDEKAGGSQTIMRVAKGLEDVKALFEEQLRAKDQQIAGLSRMLESVLGKFEGVTDDQLSEVMTIFDGNYNSYVMDTVLNVMSMLKPTVKPVYHGGKVGGTPLSYADNMVITR